VSKPHLSLREFTPELASHFRRINEEWIRAMFRLEPIDEAVISDPQGRILAGGGCILFVEAEGHGIVGTGALMRTGPGEYELTKMGVTESARGLGAGDFLLKALIARARALGATHLYLLTNQRCEAAIHLYEKNGFRPDTETRARCGDEYARCDVAMRYREE
jgi:GNAT superfamily N-acetyltransferase